MSMELIVLGSGSFAPGRKTVRNPSGHAVRLGSRLMLFDLGFGNVRQLARAGLSREEVTDAFFTHRHPDHTGDLAALLFVFHFEAKPKTGRLRLWGPPGFKDFCRRLTQAHRPWLTPRGYKLEIREIRSGQTVRGPEWEVSALHMPHWTPALAYKLVCGGKTLVYSGDTGFNIGLSLFAAGCDLLLLECTQDRRHPLEGHLTPKEALAIVSASGCRRAVLTHLSDESAAEARRLLARKQGHVVLSRDLMRVRI